MCPRYYHSADACMCTEIALLLSQYSSCYNAHKFTAQTTCYPIQTYHYRQYASIGINTPYELKHFCYNVIVFLIFFLDSVFMLVMSMQCLKTSSSCLCIACAYIINSPCRFKGNRNSAQLWLLCYLLSLNIVILGQQQYYTFSLLHVP